MSYIDVKEAASMWNVTERRVTTLCRTGRIQGAYKDGKYWFIPSNAKMPLDGRKTGHRLPEERQYLPLPIGISDFKEAVSNYYYVDKTLMIRDFLDHIPKVSLFTRPRRFGKTLNMDMLRVYFEKTKEDTSKYFKDKAIWQCEEKYKKHQGKYPVIFLSFKDVKFETWKDTFYNLAHLIRVEYERHQNILSGSSCTASEKEYFNKILSGNISEQELMGALREISRMLDKYYEKAPIIIIDEYDTPIQQGYNCGYYDSVILFMRNLFSGAFKDNNHLSYGFLTGILRVAKESVFSGLNNLKENSIFEERYSEYFGFTNEEVLAMLAYYGKSEKYEELREWYDGYRFGDKDIFNPWSVINYMDEKCRPKAFWQSTGSNDIIREIVNQATPEIQENLQLLLQRKTISTYVDTSVIYPEIKRNPLSIYSFLLMAGYLKRSDEEMLLDNSFICEVAIPNKEIAYVFEKEILSALEKNITQSVALSIQQAVMQRDIESLQKHIREFLSQSVSFYDGGDESFYHGLILGLSAIMNNRYVITSNRESGEGRYDICMEPYDKKTPGILIEIKYLKEANESEIENELKELSKKALSQIEEKRYDTDLRLRGVNQLMKIGMAFHKKKCETVYKLSEI